MDLSAKLEIFTVQLVSKFNFVRILSEIGWDFHGILFIRFILVCSDSEYNNRGGYDFLKTKM